MNNLKILVAGATGFVGTQLISDLLNQTSHEILGLSRRSGVSRNPRLEIKACDLYSLPEIDQALRNCDIAVYLVHSMAKPSSRLFQGNFHDFDFILADNFARAASRNKVKHIIYVSGMVPHDKSNLSPHLASRFEVEKALQAWGTPVTTLRCGLVIGPRGSSFQILERIINRLPVMLLPAWMRNETQVVDLEDVIQVILKLIELPSPEASQSFDVVNPQIITYQNLLQRTAKAMKKTPWLIELPFIPIWISKYWIRFISRVPKELVYPLVESLLHPMISRAEKTLPNSLAIPFRNIDDSLKRSVRPGSSEKLPIEWNEYERRENEVQSVQRLPLPVDWNATNVAEAYRHWIPRFFRSIITVNPEGDEMIFYLLNTGFPLLKLELIHQPEFARRSAFKINGGWLSFGRQSGILEFREGIHGKFVVAAIHRFRPRLPWMIYRYTQALMHALVMARFSIFLKAQEELEK